MATGVLSNEPFSILHCDNGHDIKYYSLAPEYPLYFDHGLDALEDENYFESFTSVYHAWEQFETTAIESFFIQQFANNGVPLGTNEIYPLVHNLVKPLTVTSENSDKVYRALFAERFQQEAPKLSKKLVTLRNTIVHGRRNPEQKDVEHCIRDVYNSIKPVEPLLQTNMGERTQLDAQTVTHDFSFDSWILITVREKANYFAKLEQQKHPDENDIQIENLANLATVLGNELQERPNTLSESFSLVPKLDNIKEIIDKRHTIKEMLETLKKPSQSKSQMSAFLNQKQYQLVKSNPEKVSKPTEP
jgi:hypothetical protein